MYIASEGVVANQVCGDVTDIHSSSYNPGFHGQILDMGTEAVSLLVGAVTEIFVIDIEPDDGSISVCMEVESFGNMKIVATGILVAPKKRFVSKKLSNMSQLCLYLST